MKEISTEAFPTLSYRKEGSGDTVVLIHGFPDDSELWREVMPMLSKQFAVIVPDLPCSGGSTYKGEQLTIDLLADSIKAILDHEGINKAVFVGHSMGGYVALAIADKFRNLVSGLSLVHSTPVADDEEKKIIRKKAIDIIEKGGKSAFIRQMIPNLFSDVTTNKRKELVEYQIHKGEMLSEQCLTAFYNAMIIRPDRVNVLKNGTFPVMWVLGKDDLITPLTAVMQHCIHANVNFVYTYTDCGHMSMLEYPTNLANDVEDFSVYCFGL